MNDVLLRHRPRREQAVFVARLSVLFLLMGCASRPANSTTGQSQDGELDTQTAFEDGGIADSGRTPDAWMDAAARGDETLASCPTPAKSPLSVDVETVFDLGDEKTTRSLSQPAPDVLCLSGTAYSSTDEFTYWGAIMVIQLAPDSSTPFNAAALGITGLRFQITDWLARRVRVGLAQVNDPNIIATTRNFELNPFLHGGSNPKNIEGDETRTVPFEHFKLPYFSQIEEDVPPSLDATRLHSFQLFMANHPEDDETPYKFCVTGLQWLDACGQVVAESSLPAPAESP